mgnify:CR=1 FL=1
MIKVIIDWYKVLHCMEKIEIYIKDVIKNKNKQRKAETSRIMLHGELYQCQYSLIKFSRILILNCFSLTDFKVSSPFKAYIKNTIIYSWNR